ncbi:putative sulfate exporter family transporter [Echinicola sp. CAU 1574]|uniref:Sulfate exporter family transporter n=1 Tax=Echinicola arenosa TaxID=2774144 RepID=A0ABR9AIU8_9BACT|nr:putative sulfate exporter family transporter [Echinicola arenosa]MBD8488760.1 putative sulfate exporter family transporter [Echinicola arenosa]
MEKISQAFRNLIQLQSFLDRTFSFREILFWLVSISCLFPIIPAPLALLFGLLFANFIGFPLANNKQRTTDYLLQFAIVGLGFGIKADEAIAVGKQGFQLTLASIFITLILGWILGKYFKLDKKIAFLISAGTAICGGSAIAAVSPAIKANKSQVSVALGTVFILNSLALFVFPVVGHALALSPTQFGTWCAIAIHDTSSVVGAASQFGEQALATATTVKLARALWIIPVTLIASMIFGKGPRKTKIPYFIGLFLLAIVANTYFPFVEKYRVQFTQIAHAAMTLALFYIGCGLSKKTLFAGGIRTFGQAATLWIIISSTTLWVVTYYF